jgi:beta-galactosidase
MNRKYFPPALLSLVLVLSCLTPVRLRAAETIPLAGEWRFALDRNDAGTNEQWFAKNLPDKIQLPGVLEAQGYGDEIGIHTPWVLTLYDHFWHLRADYAAYTNAGSVKVPFLCQPPRHYLGAAWYQRDIEIPTNWQGRRVILFLERPHWKTTVWLDDKEIGSDISLCTPHEFDFGMVLPGKYRLTIRVDNRMQFPNPAGMHAMDAHSVSDSLGSAWNGIAGKIELRSTPLVWIDDARIFTDTTNKTAHVFVHIGNATGKPGQGSLSFVKGSFLPSNPIRLLGAAVNWQTNGGTGEITFALGADAKLWDEFQPVLQKFSLILFNHETNSQETTFDFCEITFGLHEFKAVGQDFVINGRKTYLRGTHFGGDFPLTGYPPTDVESWKKVIQTCKDWGLNHMRFHSWCPPEAAFEAADELGFYLQVECGMWNDFSPGSAMEKMLYAETERILRAYGNHPSFVLLSASNEAHGNWKPCLTQWVEHFRAEDPRRLYTPDTGWSLIDEPGPVTGADCLVIGRVGPNRVRGESGWFGRDYGNSLKGVNVPVIGHEVGQWVAYPDFDVIKKFTGFMQPGNYEIFRDDAKAHGLFASNDNHESPEGRAGSPLPAARVNANDGAHGVTRPTNKDFAWASGRFQLECYKEEIEANLRTPGLAGFQLLDLHDYTGQGTALVGLLDPFWEGKGYATPNEFKKFCNTVVPLARLTKRIFTTDENIDANVEVANFGETVLTNAAAAWKIVDSSGKTVSSGDWPTTTIPIGKNFALGKVSTDLSKLPAPAAYKLVVIVAQASRLQTGRPEARATFPNDWNFWLYPAEISGSTPSDVFVTHSCDEAEKKLSAGGNVLFLPRSADLDWWSPPLARVPVFWNALMGPAWSRMLGLWCDVRHPALAEFPTDANCDWQWTEILRNTRAVNLDRLPHELQPMVQAIDDWNRNYKLGVVFECKVGPGRLMVCSADLESSLDSRPVARQLRRSLLDYMAGGKFDPPVAVSAADIGRLLFDTRIMRQLGATAEGDGQNANAIIDGDPNTYWLSGDARGNGSKYPHELTVHFPAPVAMNGLILMPRQNHREHQGDIRDYTIQVSDDGNQWREITHGQLASTFDPQQIRFPQTVTAKHLKLKAFSGFGNDSTASLAELAVIYAGPKIADKSSGNVEYQGVRTASPDIDAGTDVSNKPPKPSK